MNGYCNFVNLLLFHGFWFEPVTFTALGRCRQNEVATINSSFFSFFYLSISPGYFSFLPEGVVLGQ